MVRAQTDLVPRAGVVLGYTLEENWDGDELPEGYEDRGQEKLFAAAFPGADLPDIVSCLAER